MDEFLISSDSISHTLTSLGALGAVWERLSQRIKTILEQLETEQSLMTGLDISDLNSQIDKEASILADLWSLQDALITERNTSIASYDSTRARIMRIDVWVTQIEEEKARLLSERCAAVSDIQGCEDNLGNVEDIQRGNSELIDRSEAQLASLQVWRETKEIERGRLASSIERRRLALHKIVKEF